MSSRGSKMASTKEGDDAGQAAGAGLSGIGQNRRNIRRIESVTVLEKPGRRAERSRQALRSSFIGLLFEKGFAKLTVNEVVDRANVGRSTFYEHFKSKDDLLRKVLAKRFACLANIAGSDKPSASLVPDLRHFKENHKLARTLFAPPTRRALVKTLTALIHDRLSLCHRIAAADLVIPLELIALQLAEAQLAVLESWLLGKVAARPEAIAAALFAGTQGAMTGLLNCRVDAGGDCVVSL